MAMMIDEPRLKTKTLEEPESNPNDPMTPKTIDIFQHLKLNLKNRAQKCTCGNGQMFYCIPCKISICRICNIKEHNDHLMTTKEYKNLTMKDIEHIFSDAENCLNNSEIFVQSESYKEKLINKVNEFTNEIIDKANRYKQIRLEEIDQMFATMTAYVNKTKQQIQQTKKEMKDYHDKTKKFFLINENLDEANTMFLMNYDMINIVYQKTRLIKGITYNLTRDYANFDLIEEKFQNDFISNCESMMFDRINEENALQEHWKIEERYVPKLHFIHNCDVLNCDHFIGISIRTKMYVDQINFFKSKVFESFSKTRNFAEIEKNMADFESSSKHKGSDNLFTRREALFNSKGSMINGSQTGSNPNRIKLASKDDVCLNCLILKKYFTNMMIEYYDANFRIFSKELQSSHADLLIKVDPDEEDTTSVKVHEGSNMITIYDRKNQKITKKKLPLTRNPFGYTVFPIGCRSILIGDKLYITGGRDEKKEYATVIIYDIKLNTLKRIMDFREPRSYHTLVFNDAFETLMVFGGETTNSVEIFDPTVNRWQCLPALNYPRANALFHFDKPRGMIYIMFGTEGKIMDNKYSDVIECLDLTRLKEGWMRLDYYNRAETNLRTWLSAFALNSSFLLVYGGVSARNSSKNICLLNLEKGEIEKIDKELFERLKAEACKSNKLSSIVSAFLK